jgi:hypothetical protein
MTTLTTLPIVTASPPHAEIRTGFNPADALREAKAAIRRVIEDSHVQQLPRRELLARQRQRAAQQRATARAVGLGFAGVRAYLVDRLVVRAWTLAQ